MPKDVHRASWNFSWTLSSSTSLYTYRICNGHSLRPVIFLSSVFICCLNFHTCSRSTERISLVFGSGNLLWKFSYESNFIIYWLCWCTVVKSFRPRRTEQYRLKHTPTVVFYAQLWILLTSAWYVLTSCRDAWCHLVTFALNRVPKHPAYYTHHTLLLLWTQKWSLIWYDTIYLTAIG